MVGQGNAPQTNVCSTTVFNKECMQQSGATRVQRYNYDSVHRGTTASQTEGHFVISSSGVGGGGDSPGYIRPWSAPPTPPLAYLHFVSTNLGRDLNPEPAPQSGGGGGAPFHLIWATHPRAQESLPTPRGAHPALPWLGTAKHIHTQ